MRTLKKLSYLLLLAGLLCNVSGQTQQPVPPDCVVPFFFTVTANVVNAPTSFPQPQGFYNGTVACTTWEIEYGQVGLSALSLLVQSAAPATTGVPGTPGTYGAYAGTIVTGVNPNTSTTPVQTFFSNGTVGIIWIQVTLSTATGTGSIEGKLLGWNAGHSGGAAGSGGSGCVGTSTTPCVVDGPVAAGSPPTKPPVLVAGQDGTNTQTISTDTSGRVNVIVNGNAAVLSGQQSVTGTAVALATHAAKTICVKAILGNTIPVYIGPSGVTTSTGIPLDPGDAPCLTVQNTNEIFVVASTTGASVAWVSTN